jgi:rhamnopyranosyl-N-acetylglucosaminyl-diphospho-decaprenol beta-1,3/1,4-galactofuranosyltransferase
VTDARRIAAVVVTFNRLPLLQRLLPALGAVEGLDEILVVDNHSSDGTAGWLREQAATSPVPVLTRTLDTNAGGAGGFHEGLRWAVERGADLVWLMDDDGLPDPDCLSSLLAHESDLDFWGPVVVDEADHGRLVFPIRLPGSARVVHRMPDVVAAAEDGLIRGIVIPFNGVLVTRDLVARIGLPRAQFFIWGDDHEYRLRAERAGARVATVVSARVLHPSVGNLGTPMAFGRTTYNDTPSDLKHYCMARNNLVNLREYGGTLHALAFVAKTLWFYTFTRRDPARIRLSIDAWRAALKGDYTGHQRFLR